MQSPQGMLDLRKRYLVEASRQQFAGGCQLGDQEWKRHSCYFGDWKRRCLIYWTCLYILLVKASFFDDGVYVVVLCHSSAGRSEVIFDLGTTWHTFRFCAVTLPVPLQVRCL